jgi:hypothetical protein
MDKERAGEEDRKAMWKGMMGMRMGNENGNGNGTGKEQKPFYGIFILVVYPRSYTYPVSAMAMFTSLLKKVA